jgi:hypothetical protein
VFSFLLLGLVIKQVRRPPRRTGWAFRFLRYALPRLQSTANQPVKQIAQGRPQVQTEAREGSAIDSPTHKPVAKATPRLNFKTSTIVDMDDT